MIFFIELFKIERYSMINIDIISDTVCPWCFIGIKRLEKAMSNSKNIKFNITWHPFQLNPEMPKAGVDRNLYLSTKFGGEKRAKEIYKQIELVGSSTGIKFEFDKILIMPNSLNTHVLLEYAKKFDLQNEIANDLFINYFTKGKNISDNETLIFIANKNGINDFNEDILKNKNDLKKIVQESDIASRRKGITGVPFFIINNKYAISGAQDNEVFEKVFETCLLEN